MLLVSGYHGNREFERTKRLVTANKNKVKKYDVHYNQHMGVW